MLNFNWLSDIPLSIAKYIVLLAFIFPLLFALLLKRNYIFEGAADKRLWRNLKIWVFVLTIIMLTVYLYF